MAPPREEDGLEARLERAGAAATVTRAAICKLGLHSITVVTAMTPAGGFVRTLLESDLDRPHLLAVLRAAVRHLEGEDAVKGIVRRHVANMQPLHPTPYRRETANVTRTAVGAPDGGVKL